MANKYYVYLIDTRKLEGPFSFRKAMSMKVYYDSSGVFTKIMKVVVDENGKEAK